MKTTIKIEGDRLIINNIKKIDDVKKIDDFISSFLYFIGLDDKELEELKKTYEKNKELFKMYIAQAYAARFDGNKLEVIDVLSNMMGAEYFDFFRVEPEDI